MAQTLTPAPPRAAPPASLPSLLGSGRVFGALVIDWGFLSQKEESKVASHNYSGLGILRSTATVATARISAEYNGYNLSS